MTANVIAGLTEGGLGESIRALEEVLERANWAALPATLLISGLLDDLRAELEKRKEGL